MKRKDFYSEYYNRTNRVFSDHVIGGKKERDEAWRKGQYSFPKFYRKIFIFIQYCVLIFCWMPMLYDHKTWVYVPIGIVYFLIQSYICDFSIIKIELLYSIYRKDNVYCSVLYDIFL